MELAREQQGGAKFVIKVSPGMELPGTTENIVLSKNIDLSQAILFSQPASFKNAVANASTGAVASVTTTTEKPIIISLPKIPPSSVTPPLVTINSQLPQFNPTSATLPQTLSNVTKVSNLKVIKTMATQTMLSAIKGSVPTELSLKTNFIKKLSNQGITFNEEVLKIVNEYCDGSKRFYMERVKGVLDRVEVPRCECKELNVKIGDLLAENMQLKRELNENMNAITGNVDCAKGEPSTAPETKAPTGSIGICATDAGRKSTGVSDDAFGEVLSTIRAVGAQFLDTVESSLRNSLKHGAPLAQSTCASTPDTRTPNSAPSTIGAVATHLLQLLEDSHDTIPEYTEQLEQLLLKLFDAVDQSQYVVDSADIAQVPPDTNYVLLNDVNMGIHLDIPQISAIRPEQLVKGSYYIFHDLYQYLQSCNVDVNAFGEKPIHRDVLSDSLLEVKRQCLVLKLTSLGVDIVNQDCHTPLHLAVMNDASVEVVRALLRYGADYRARDGDGNTVLHLAVQSGTLAKLLHEDVRRMVDERCFARVLDVHNNDGFSALHLAAIKGSSEMVQLLLSCGASVDLCDTKSGRTALYHAVEGSYVAVVNTLNEHGASPYVPTYSGTSVFDALTDSDSDFSPDMKILFYNVTLRGRRVDAELDEMPLAKEKRARRRAQLLDVESKRKRK